jgi:hypothetical protein
MYGAKYAPGFWKPKSQNRMIPKKGYSETQGMLKAAKGK